MDVDKLDDMAFARKLQNCYATNPKIRKMAQEHSQKLKKRVI